MELIVSTFGCIKDAFRKQYTPVENGDGSIVYVFTGSPKHYACPYCFAKETLHVLKFRRVGSGYFECPGCRACFPIKPGHKEGLTMGTTIA